MISGKFLRDEKKHVYFFFTENSQFLKFSVRAGVLFCCNKFFFLKVGLSWLKFGAI